jgi:putative DNA primase/helicase
VCLLPSDTKSGTWLGDDEVPPVSSLIYAQNCVYNWQTGEKYPCSPRWFNQSCVNTVIDDDAPEPKRWIQFLRELWDDDQASKDLLHEFMGLTLTLDTSFQKLLLMIGATRSGKGTIARTLTAIHGQQNVAAPAAASLVQEFGLQPLRGKPLAIISDARFAGRDIQVTIERLLNITGEDSVVVNQKYRVPVTVKLLTRFIIASNELPRLPDNAGALANRVLVLQLTESFLGREDRGLEAALLQELPGIVKLMLDGLRRLHRQGFTQTAYQTALVQNMEDLGSPLRAFVRECCEIKKKKKVYSETLYHAWTRWEGNEGCTHSVFGRNLKTCCPGIDRKKREGNYYYVGIGLRASKSVLRIVHPNTSVPMVKTVELPMEG